MDHASCARVELTLKNLIRQKGIDEMAGLGLPPPTEREIMFTEAAQDEKGFAMRSSVGNFWARAMKSDKKMEAEYKAIGKSYAAQRLFRAAWAAGEATQMKETRMKSQETTPAARCTYARLPPGR